jgi:mono/diheme cytochrome c family protein
MLFRKAFGGASICLAFGAIGLALALSVAAVGQSTPMNQTDSLPPGAMQAKARAACLECHQSRIILQQRLSKTAWTKEVDKMIKWGALVDEKDRDALIDYLSTNFSPDKPPYEPPRSSPIAKNKP